MSDKSLPQVVKIGDFTWIVAPELEPEPVPVPSAPVCMAARIQALTGGKKKHYTEFNCSPHNPNAKLHCSPGDRKLCKACYIWRNQPIEGW